MNIYEENLTQLKIARETFAKAMQGKKELIDNLKQSELYKILEDSQKIAEDAIEEFESKIQAQALADYQANANKKPHEKVQIKIFKTFKIVYPKVVRDWVVKNLQDALKVDEAKVKKYAQEIGTVEGTEIGEEARVQIASEL